MAMARRFAPALLLPLLLFSLSSTIAIAKPPSKSSSPTARKEDLKFIKCAVCNQIANQLSRHVKRKRDKVAPKKLSEYQIIELAENICNLKRQEGDWLLHQDIVEEGDKLVLVEQEDEGECKTECKTIEKACQEVIGYHDTDVAEFMFKGAAERDELSQYLCKDLSKACRGEIPPVPKDRIPGEVFTPKSSKDAEIERIMRSMSEMPGAPGMKMYSKDDLMRGMPNFDGEEEDDDEDDEEDVQETPGKGTTAGAKGTTLNQFINHGQSFLSTMYQETRKHIEKAADWFGRWWSGKSNSELSKSKAGEL